VRSEQSLSDVSETDAAVEELIKQHVPAARFAGRRASEIAYRRPNAPRPRAPPPPPPWSSSLAPYLLRNFEKNSQLELHALMTGKKGERGRGSSCRWYGTIHGPVVCLPSNTSTSCSFAELLRDLEGSKERLGVKGYGLAETTLEEVFLAVTQQGKAWEGREPHPPGPAAAPEDSSIPISQDAGAPLLGNGVCNDVEGGSDYDGDLRRPTRLLVLYSPPPPPSIASLPPQNRSTKHHKAWVAEV